MDLRNVSCLTATSSHHWERDGIRQKPESLDNWICWLCSATPNAHTKHWIAYEHWKQFSAHTKWVVFCIVHCLMLSAMPLYNIELDWKENTNGSIRPIYGRQFQLKSKMAASYFSIMSSDRPEWFYSSIQVQLYDISGDSKRTHRILKSYHFNIFHFILLKLYNYVLGCVFSHWWEN